jgi:hypothetical protein
MIDSCLALSYEGTVAVLIGKLTWEALGIFPMDLSSLVQSALVKQSLLEKPRWRPSKRLDRHPTLESQGNLAVLHKK